MGGGQGEREARPRSPDLVLDALDAVEDDGTVAALDVVEAVRGGVDGGAAEHGHLDQRAGPRRGHRNPAAALHVHPRRACRGPPETELLWWGEQGGALWGAAARVFRGFCLGRLERNGEGAGLVMKGGGVIGAFGF